MPLNDTEENLYYVWGPNNKMVSFIIIYKVSVIPRYLVSVFESSQADSEINLGREGSQEYLVRL